jgi:hypothetical protein
MSDNESLSLHDATNLLLEECRTILPGIQALFGFQLIAIFNVSFDEKLGNFEQRLHLAAIVLVILAVALIMTPAAYHRQTAPMNVNAAVIKLASNALLSAMIALMAGLTIDSYIVAKAILSSAIAALLIAVPLFITIFVLWFLLPRFRTLRKLVEAELTEGQ